MAYAIMGGLAVATALTLVFLPALYVAWFRIREDPLQMVPTEVSSHESAAS
jgi:multidrug efflux pump